MNRRDFIRLTLVVSACVCIGACQRSVTERTTQASGMGVGARSVPARPAPSSAQADAPASPSLAHVDAALHAHAVAVDESLAVRLVGTVGPDGSWSLVDVEVRRDAGRVVVRPLVEHRDVDMAILMVVPLDVRIALALAAGEHVVEVHGANEVFSETVVVSANPERRAPQTRAELRSTEATSSSRLLVVIEGIPTDGFVDALEWREIGAAGHGEWQRIDSAQRFHGELRAHLQFTRANRTFQRIEVRAIDGQGRRDPTPAQVDLP